MIRAAALIGAAGLVACSPEPEPPTNAVTIAVPTPEPVATPSPAVLAPGELPSPELDRARRLAGGWEGSGSVARFGAPGRPASFAIRCDRDAGTITFLRPGARGSTIRLVATSGAATYPAQLVAGVVTAEASAEDRFVADALSRAQGAIAVQVDQGEALALPAASAISSVIEDCRGPR